MKMIIYLRSGKITYADVSELADETDSKSVVLMDVWVRVPPSALEEELSD